MDSNDDDLQEQAAAKAAQDLLRATIKQSLRFEALAKLAVFRARAPEKYRRLMYLEAKRRGLTKPQGSS